MASWILTPCMVSLRDEFNTLAPNRDKSSDGSIGDSAHASSSSDHNPDETGATPQEDSDNINEVRAIDVDEDLRLPGITMESRVQILVNRHRQGKDNRLKNIIYNKRIWSKSWGWTPREYTGKNPHDKHAHFSGDAAFDNKTGPWGLLEGIEDNMNLPKQGDKGEPVKYWQYVLTRIGESALQVDGDYGKLTAAALKRIWIKLAKPVPSEVNSYDGSYISGWLAMKMHQELARVSVPSSTTPPPVATQEQINQAFEAYMMNRQATFRVTGDLDGTVNLDVV